MKKNALLLAKIGADTAENERNFANNWQLPCGSRPPGAPDWTPAITSLHRWRPRDSRMTSGQELGYKEVSWRRKGSTVIH